MGGAAESTLGPAAKTRLTVQTLIKQTTRTDTSAHLKARMNTPLGTESLQLLDHRGWEKVSDAGNDGILQLPALGSLNNQMGRGKANEFPWSNNFGFLPESWK